MDRKRARRPRVILQFFYAPPEVKSNQVGVRLARIFVLTFVLVCLGVAACGETPLTIVEDSLPPLNSGEEFHLQLHATGGAPPYRWSVAGGELPEGITLDPGGLLAGRPAKSGKITIVVMVVDSSHPGQAARKELQLEVSGALLLDWLQPPAVHDDRIDGSVQVSNGSKDAFDLTVVVEAVSTDDQRGTAIGYEHFQLKPGVANYRISFGSMMPHGTYIIHADAVAKIPARSSILRQRLQTSQPLPVTVGP